MEIKDALEFLELKAKALEDEAGIAETPLEAVILLAKANGIHWCISTLERQEKSAQQAVGADATSSPFSGVYSGTVNNNKL